MIERLNELFALPQALAFVRDRNNFAKISMTSGARHHADIYLYGGQVLSWSGPNGEELLFTSSRAFYERGKAIRGGIPIIFPQFGKGELPSHGFARTSMWDVKETKFAAEGVPSVTLKLEDGPMARNVWPHRFVLEYTITLSDRLHCHLKVVNCDTTPFFFYAGFHNYLRIADINRTSIQGLKDVTYMDLSAERRYAVQSFDPVVFECRTDNAYLNAPDSVRVTDQLMNREYTITKGGLRDVVLWNPWENGSKTFEDLAPQEYLSFVCVEPAIVNQKITLEPREKHECWQEISYR